MTERLHLLLLALSMRRDEQGQVRTVRVCHHAYRSSSTSVLRSCCAGMELHGQLLLLLLFIVHALHW